MDTFTTGIGGALIGKAYLAEKHGRVALWAVTLGSVFPDSDVVFELVDANDIATLEIHRGVTHSFVGLPLFAVGLAALTRWAARRWRWQAPSFLGLTGIYALGLAFHILTDLVTSFGTMIWSPLARTRAAWDLVFIIDFTLTAIVLLPQVAAWVFRRRENQWRRAIVMWLAFSLAALGVQWLAHTLRVGYSPWFTVTAYGLLALLFFLPTTRDWGVRLGRARWCRAGLLAMVGYGLLCAAAHRMALRRVEAFAAEHRLAVEHLGALPAPPALTRWSGLIRTPTGVYVARLNLFDRTAPRFRFAADSSPNTYTDAARQLPAVKTYLWFARFPVVRYSERDGHRIVEFTDLRFSRGNPDDTRAGFTFRVALDSSGRVIEQGWVED